MSLSVVRPLYFVYFISGKFKVCMNLNYFYDISKIAALEAKQMMYVLAIVNLQIMHIVPKCLVKVSVEYQKL
jgi:hypothetical protein